MCPQVHSSVGNNHKAPYFSDIRQEDIGEESQGDDCEAEPPPPPALAPYNQVSYTPYPPDVARASPQMDNRIRYSRRDASLSNESKSTTPSHGSSELINSPSSRGRNHRDWEMSSTPSTGSVHSPHSVGSKGNNVHPLKPNNVNHHENNIHAQNNHKSNSAPKNGEPHHVPMRSREGSRLRRPISFVTALKMSEEAESMMKSQEKPTNNAPARSKSAKADLNRTNHVPRVNASFNSSHNASHIVQANGGEDRTQMMTYEVSV